MDQKSELETRTVLDEVESNPAGAPGVGGDDPTKQQAIEILQTCYDPEIPVDIYELGLVYEINTATPGALEVKMTLTSPSCPVAESLPLEVESKLMGVPGVDTVSVEVVWDPPWSMDNMSEAAKLQLGLL